ncbi:MAG: radical SAM protein, partial [Gemmatimonadetes bacterium]|nr:radical SAM protein [Gemmatimonadota bacterium]
LLSDGSSAIDGFIQACPSRYVEQALHLISEVDSSLGSYLRGIVLEALAIAAGDGLRLPLVYNTSSYDSAESLELLDGVVDIYMPDFKYWKPESGQRFLKAADYAEVARARITEMHRQVGDLRVDEQGLAYRGLNIRHLVMPGALDETESILRWIRDELGRSTYVNVMDQYYPAGRVDQRLYPELNRRLTAAEFEEARRIAWRLGLERLDQRRPHQLLQRRLVGQ